MAFSFDHDNHLGKGKTNKQISLIEFLTKNHHLLLDPKLLYQSILHIFGKECLKYKSETNKVRS